MLRNQCHKRILMQKIQTNVTNVATPKTSSYAMILLETVSLSTETEAHSAFLACGVSIAFSAQCTAAALVGLLWPVTHCI